MCPMSSIQIWEFGHESVVVAEKLKNNKAFPVIYVRSLDVQKSTLYPLQCVPVWRSTRGIPNSWHFLEQYPSEIKLMTFSDSLYHFTVLHGIGGRETLFFCFVFRNKAFIYKPQVIHFWQQHNNISTNQFSWCPLCGRTKGVISNRGKNTENYHLKLLWPSRLTLWCSKKKNPRYNYFYSSARKEMSRLP